MKTNKHVMLFVLLAGVSLLWAQIPYGIGDNAEVPYVTAGTLTLDGVADEAAWSSAGTVPMLDWSDGTSFDEAPIDQENKLLWTEDTLFVYVYVTDSVVQTAANLWESDHILLGIDRTLAGDGIMDWNWAGWPLNWPDQGPALLKIYEGGITANWGFDNISPVDSGWVAGTVFVDSAGGVTNGWGMEIKIWVPGLQGNSMIGFNLGGATFTYIEWGQWYCWHPTPADTLVVDYPDLEYGMLSSDMQRYSGCFGTLTMTGGEPYGGMEEISVPYVAPHSFTLDGVLDEAAWDNAAQIDITQYWEGGWNQGLGEYPTVFPTTRLFWSEDTIFVSVETEDFDLFLGLDSAEWVGDAIFVGVDGPMRGTGEYDGDWSGGWWNQPDLGPTIYRVDARDIATSLYDALDNGWVRGGITINDDTTMWTFELAIYMPQAAAGSRVGFTMGGVETTADPDYWWDDPVENGQGTDYAWYAWYPAEGIPGYYAGHFLNSTDVFGTMFCSSSTVGNDNRVTPRLPERFTLNPNYPNPFNPQTSITYDIAHSAHVTLEVFNVIGQKVATLVNTTQHPGRHHVTWNAGDLASGVYFTSLSIDGKPAATHKMLLIK